jgi:hypothetical protein
MHLVKRGPGRPRKFGRPSRPVTVTLPEDAIAHLRAIDADLGQAIVTALTRKRPPRSLARHPAELASYGKHAVIVVTPLNVLKRLAGVQLVPIGNNRALISLEHPRSVPKLELDIRDALEHHRIGHPERQALKALADILRHARLSQKISIDERTIIVLEAKRQRRA